MKLKISTYWLFIICLLLAACSGTKHLPAGEKLYRGATVKLVSEEKIKSKKKKLIKKMAENTILPKPNKMFLGMRPKLWMYMLAGESPHSKYKKWLKKNGEAPVLMSRVKPMAAAEIIDAKLYNNGIFKCFTGFKVIENKHSSKIIFTSHIHKPFTVKELICSISDDSINHIILREKHKSLIKAGEDYSLDKLKLERIRIDILLKNDGFFYFRSRLFIV